jgi:release factor glutamine methyltransferase
MARALRRAGFGEAVRFTASDVSQEALSLAVENAVAQGVADLIDFRVADLLSTNVEVDGLPGVIVANLPYVVSTTLDELGPAIAFEPRLALDGGSDGLDLVRRLLGELPRVLAPDGLALLEIGSDQETAALTAAETALPGWTATVHRDLAGLPRVLELERPARKPEAAEHDPEPPSR